MYFFDDLPLFLNIHAPIVDRIYPTPDTRSFSTDEFTPLGKTAGIFLYCSTLRGCKHLHLIQICGTKVIIY